MNAMQDGGARMTYDTGAMREPSTNKGAYELVSPFALERIAIWYELGARKYTKETTVSNWEAANELCRALQAETSADYVAARFIARDYAEGAMREIFGAQTPDMPNASERTQGNGTGNILNKSKSARESGQQTQSCANGTDGQSEPVCCEAAALPRKRLHVWLRGREIPAQFAEGALMGSGLCILTMTTKAGLQEDTYVAAATTASECLTNLQKCFVGQYPTSQTLRRLTFAHRDNDQIDLTVSGNRNWEKGIPFNRLIQSGIRHMIRWMKGDRSEDHLAAVCWNVMAMMHFEETGQADELNNYPAYKRAEPCEADKPALSPMGCAIIAEDFDGCLCANAWPEIGAPNEDEIAYLKMRKAEGAKLILWTCREGDMLTKALQWCAERGLTFDAANQNLPEMNAHYGNDSRKIGATEYRDDKAVAVKAQEVQT